MMDKHLRHDHLKDPVTGTSKQAYLNFLAAAAKKSSMIGTFNPGHLNIKYLNR